MLGKGIVKTVKLTENFKYEDFSRYYDNTDIPLFVIDSNGLVSPVTLDTSVNLSPGHTLIALVAAKDNEQSPATVSRPQQPDYECKSPS
jgi:hypothetical protein